MSFSSEESDSESESPAPAEAPLSSVSERVGTAADGGVGGGVSVATDDVSILSSSSGRLPTQTRG